MKNLYSEADARAAGLLEEVGLSREELVAKIKYAVAGFSKTQLS